MVHIDAFGDLLLWNSDSWILRHLRKLVPVLQSSTLPNHALNTFLC